MSERENNRTALPTVKKRMAALVFIVFVFFGILVVRIAAISVANHEKYASLAISQQLNDVILTPRRGTIYDRNMNVLAESAACWTVALAPNSIDEGNYETIAAGLAEILGVDQGAVLEKCSEDNWFSVVKRKADEADVDRIRAFMSANEIPGNNITFEEDSKRYYPYGNFAAHLLGFVGTDNYGLAGLEAYYDSALSGTAGRMITAENAVGTEMYYESKTVYDAKEGYSLKLTVDEVIQHYLESALDTAEREHNVKERAVGIVMNPNTGEIYAMATKGDYDPNDPFTVHNTRALERMQLVLSGGEGAPEAEEYYKGLLSPEEAGEWDALSSEDKYSKAYGLEQQLQWNNKAINQLYEPGSVFKTVTASIALETNSCTLDSSFYCAGYIQVADRVMNCAITAHGWESFAECLINSCNPGFVQIGQEIGIRQFSSYFKNFGLTQPTGIDLPGEAESLYVAEEDMGIVELASSSYGQTNAITPIQMITAFSAAINGGYLVQPYVVSQVLDADGNVVESAGNPVKRQVVSEETSRQVALILEQIIDPDGGNKGNAYVAGYRIGGKSGTAQKLNSADDRAFVASFCTFAPVDDPEVIVLIILDEASSYSIYGTALVGPIVGNVMANVLPYLGVEPVYSEGEQASGGVGVPNVVGRPVSEAYAELQKRGLQYEVIGEGLAVEHQNPAGGYAASVGTTVYLYTNADYTERVATVPDLTGYSAEDAAYFLGLAGLNIKTTGNTDGTYAVSQNLAEGEEVPAGTVVAVDFVDISFSD